MENQNGNQWELDGNCKYCRRRTYCGNGCKKFKTAMKLYFHNLAREKKENQDEKIQRCCVCRVIGKNHYCY